MYDTSEAGRGMSLSWQEMRRIHKIFGTPAPDSPQAQSEFHVTRRAKWINEEVEELIEAGDDIIEQADAYLDVIVFAVGGLVELGIDPGPLYSIILDSQYAKLWEDGKPRVREHDGKWIKPENWQDPAPLLEKEIERQINAS